MNWINIFISLISNPAIQAMLKQVEDTLHRQSLAGPNVSPGEPHPDVKKVVDDIVAKHVRAP